jgi:hypothetical protein
VTDAREVDRHLVAVLNQVLDAIYQVKQAAWSATTSPAREDLHDLFEFLVEQSGRFMMAEERIDGRSPDVSSPSTHQRGNLASEAGGDHDETVALLAQRLNALADDVRARAGAISDAQESSMLYELADGLNARTTRLLERG